MTGFGRDPKFPQRPSHPDFWILAKVVSDQDMLADLQKPVQEIVAELGVDFEALLYVAKQRVLRAAGPRISRETEGVLAALWLDAFTSGINYTKEKTDGKS